MRARQSLKPRRPPCLGAATGVGHRRLQDVGEGGQQASSEESAGGTRAEREGIIARHRRGTRRGQGEGGGEGDDEGKGDAKGDGAKAKEGAECSLDLGAIGGVVIS